MEDISIDLWNNIKTDFVNSYSNNETIKSLIVKANKEIATYEDATLYAEEVGRLWSKALKSNLTVENLPDGKLYFNIANKTIKPALSGDYDRVVEYVEQIQTNLNKSAKIGMKAVIPKIDANRIKNLIDKISSDEEIFEDTSWLIEDGVVENFSRSVVSDFVMENARVQKDAGLHSWIERKVGSNGCCAWCRSVAGRYVYGEQPEDFFRVHKDCNCVIDFHPSKKPVERIVFRNGRKITTVL